MDIDASSFVSSPHSFEPQFAGIAGNSYYHVHSISKPPTKFSSRPVKKIPPPPASLVVKPVYSPLVQQPSNQKIQLLHSQTSSLLRGTGKKRSQIKALLFLEHRQKTRQYQDQIWSWLLNFSSPDEFYVFSTSSRIQVRFFALLVSMVSS